MDAVDPSVATEVCSLLPVEVDADGGDAVAGVVLAVVCPVKLGSGVSAVVMASRV